MAGEGSRTAAMFGCNTYAYMLSQPAERCIERLADRGFQEFELMVHPGHLWPGELSAPERAALRALLAQRGARLTTLNLPNIDINIASTTPEMRAYSVELLAETVKLAGELGAAGVVISPGKASPLLPAELDQLRGYFFGALDRLCPIAQAGGTALWLENVPFSYIATIGGLMDALARYGDDSVRIVYDVANAYFIDEDFAEGLKRCRPRLALVHLSDTTQQLFRHDPVGLGTVPFAAIPAALAAVGYDARPMLEIISRDPDREILASTEKLVALGFKPAS